MSELDTEKISPAVAVTVEASRPELPIGAHGISDSGQRNLGRNAAERHTRMAENVLDGLDLRFRGGEEIRTEISARFTRKTVVDDLSAAGSSLTEWVTDGDRRVASSFAHRPRSPSARGEESRR